MCKLQIDVEHKEEIDLKKKTIYFLTNKTLISVFVDDL